MTVAAIDLGTNTCRLLIADPDGNGGLVERDRRLSFVRLGQGVDATGEFHPDALARAEACFREYAEVIAAHPVTATRLVATSATRDVGNRGELARIVAETLGVELDVIPGTDEARLSFTGALSGVSAPTAPVLVVDSGGGSTELIRGSADGTIEASTSIDLGSRRIRERFLHDEVPTPEQLAEAQSAIEGALDTSGVELDDVATLIGVAGTVTSIAALALGLEAYDRQAVHGSATSREDVHAITRQLTTSTRDEIAALGPVAPERAEVLGAGALIVDAITRRVATDVLVASEADILDGVALELLASHS